MNPQFSIAVTAAGRETGFIIPKTGDKENEAQKSDLVKSSTAQKG